MYGLWMVDFGFVRQWRFQAEGFMIPSRLDYRCIKSGVGYGGTGELDTTVTEFDSRHLNIT
jgi:hypothetical protein